MCRIARLVTNLALPCPISLGDSKSRFNVAPWGCAQVTRHMGTQRGCAQVTGHVETIRGCAQVTGHVETLRGCAQVTCHVDAQRGCAQVTCHVDAQRGCAQVTRHVETQRGCAQVTWRLKRDVLMGCNLDTFSSSTLSSPFSQYDKIMWWCES